MILEHTNREFLIPMDIKTCEFPVCQDRQAYYNFQNHTFNNIKISFIDFPILFILISTFVCDAQTENSRMVILADMGNEPDEEQQIGHLLLYANEIGRFLK